MVNVKSPEREFRTFCFSIYVSFRSKRIKLGLAFFHIMENVLNVFIIFYFLY